MDAVSKERKFYRETCKASRDSTKQHLVHLHLLHQDLPNSVDTTIHYSFDMAQQVIYATQISISTSLINSGTLDPHQPEPIFF